MSQPRSEAWQLAEAGLNPQELALALGVRLDQARIYLRRHKAETIRTTGSRAQRNSRTAPSKWTDRFSLTQLWSLGTGSR